MGRTIGLIVSGIFGALVMLLGLAMLMRALIGAIDALVPDPPPRQIAVKSVLRSADFPLCVTVKPAPLLRTPNGPVDYRLGQPSRDRGET